MADRIVAGACPRHIPSDFVTVSRSRLSALIFVCAQLRTRNEKLAGAHPSKIDATLADNAAHAITQIRAEVALDRGER